MQWSQYESLWAPDGHGNVSDVEYVEQWPVLVKQNGVSGRWSQSSSTRHALQMPDPILLSQRPIFRSRQSESALQPQTPVSLKQIGAATSQFASYWQGVVQLPETNPQTVRSSLRFWQTSFDVQPPQMLAGILHSGL
jgi:hypothetical protein